MLNNSCPNKNNEYLHPNYIQPLPTTLDSKKSPLSMLVQTCQNIGKDSPRTKPSGLCQTPNATESKPGRRSPATVEKPKVKAVSPLPQSNLSSARAATTTGASSGPGTVVSNPSGGVASQSLVVGPIPSSTAAFEPKFSSMAALNSLASPTKPPPPASDLLTSPLLNNSLAAYYLPMLTQQHNGADQLAALALAQQHKANADIAGAYLRALAASNLSAAAVAATAPPASRDLHCSSCTQCCAATPLALNQLALSAAAAANAPGCKLCGGHQTAGGEIHKTPAPELNVVCQWMSGEASCGKRFANQQQLIEHIQTVHTALSVSTANERTCSPSDSNEKSPATTTTIPVAPTTRLSPSLNALTALTVNAAAGVGNQNDPSGIAATAGLGKMAASLSPSRFHPYCRPNAAAAAVASLSSVVSPLPNVTALQHQLQLYSALYGAGQNRIGAE